MQKTNIYFFSDDAWFLLALKYMYADMGASFHQLNSRKNIDLCINLMKRKGIVIIAAESPAIMQLIISAPDDIRAQLVFVIDTPLVVDILCCKFLNRNNEFDRVIVSKYAMPEVLNRVIYPFLNSVNKPRNIYPAVRISVKERDIWYLTLCGRTVEELSLGIGLSDKTVYAHRAMMISKMGLQRRNQLQYLRYGGVFIE